jgi:hypothetical protein
VGPWRPTPIVIWSSKTSSWFWAGLRPADFCFEDETIGFFEDETIGFRSTFLGPSVTDWLTLVAMGECPAMEALR